MTEPFIIQLHGAKNSGKTTVARLLCQLMPSDLPGLFLDGGEGAVLSASLLGQNPPFSTWIDSCKPLLMSVGLLELDNEEMDWRMADAVMTLGERLDVLVQGEIPNNLTHSGHEMMTYGVKRLWGQYAWTVSDDPHEVVTQWLQSVFQPFGVLLLSTADDDAVWQQTVNHMQERYPANKWAVLMNHVSADVSLEPSFLEQWVYHGQRDGMCRSIGKLPQVSSDCHDPVGVLLPPLQSALYHLNMPFQPEGV